MTDRGMGSEWGQKLGGAGAEPLEWCSPGGGAELHAHRPLHRDCRHRWPCATRAAGSGCKGLQSQILTPNYLRGSSQSLCRAFSSAFPTAEHAAEAHHVPCLITGPALPPQLSPCDLAH